MWVLFKLGLFIVFSLTSTICDYNAVIFHFPEFDYKETSKNELTFREFESACDQSNRCVDTLGIERTRCIRECVSPSCYKDIYQFDELEDGEIDVRLNSFKGCFIQRLSRTRN